MRRAGSILDTREEAFHLAEGPDKARAVAEPALEFFCCRKAAVTGRLRAYGCTVSRGRALPNRATDEKRP